MKKKKKKKAIQISSNMLRLRADEQQLIGITYCNYVLWL